MAAIYRQHAAQTLRQLREHARWEYNYRRLMGQDDAAELSLAHWDHYGELLSLLVDG